jgi:2-polyprenyl-3-methyl-5-hydroxy-6-metoxy-1,4-benzoquinol methylase
MTRKDFEIILIDPQQKKHQSLTQTPLDDHYQKMSPGKNKDFRTFSIASKMLDIAGDNAGRTLDIGCGFGILVAMGQKQGKNVIGLDTSPSMIQGSIDYLKSQGLDPDKVQVISAEELIEQGKTFDTIIMIDVLEHIDDPEGFLKLVEELLAPGGRLILSVPAHKEFYDSRDEMLGHFLRYDKETLLAHLSVTSLNVIDLYYWNFLGWIERQTRMRFFPTINTSAQYDFRYSGSLMTRTLNRLLRGYFFLIENRIRPFNGLTLILIARKND